MRRSCREHVECLAKWQIWIVGRSEESGQWSRTRVAVVTGGGRGIGRGITLALADLGFALVVNYRTDAAGR